MRFTFTVKPRVMTAQSRDDLMRMVTNNYSMTNTFTTNMSNVLRTPSFGGRNSDDSKVRAYNIIKINAKYKQIKDKNGHTKKSHLVRSKQYIAYVYDFDVNVLKHLGLGIKQNSKYFRITKVK